MNPYSDDPNFIQSVFGIFSNHVPVVVYRIQRFPDLRILFVSETILGLVGYSAQDYYSNPQLSETIVHPDDRDKLGLFFTYPDQTKIVVKLRFFHKNGTIVWTEHHVHFQENFANGIILDITQQQETERKLRESEQRLVVALQSTGVAIWEWDMDSSLVTWKTDVDQVLGLEKGTLNEKIDSYFDVIHPADRQGFLDTMQLSLQASDYHSAEHRIIDKYGEIRWIESFSQIFRDVSGKPNRWLGSLRNITDQRLAQEENRELYNRTRNQSSAIVELALDESFTNGDLENSFKLILQTGCKVLDTARSSIWMFREDYSSLDCVYYYLSRSDEFLIGKHSLDCSTIPKYFNNILEGRVFVSNDTFHDTRTSEFTDSYSRKVNVRGLMDASIRVRGKIVGVLSIENTEQPRNWKSDEVMFAGLLADQASLSIINSERKQNEEQIRLLNRNLERIVEERTQQLRKTNQDLQRTLENLSKTQNQLILSEKMASLGQLIAGIAHEINNPIGAIKASLELIRMLRTRSFLKNNHYSDIASRMTEEELDLAEEFYRFAIAIKDTPTGLQSRKVKQSLESTFREMGMAQANKIADKLTDIGLISIPDQFKSLLSKNYNEELLLQMADRIFEEKNFASIESSILRVTNLVRSLKNFSHMQSTGDKVLFDLSESIETVLTLFQNKMKSGIELLKNYEPLPKIPCYPDDLIQLWTNLIQNALQAMAYRGTLEINLRFNSGKTLVIVEIIDSGPGIPPENREKIFQPFFTTKPLGEGSGLGLDICLKIVDNHRGHLTCESRSGRTVFRVELPVR